MNRQSKWMAVGRSWQLGIGVIALGALTLATSGPIRADIAPRAALVAAASSTGAGATEARAPGIDTLIEHLHQSFRITPAQEPLWQNVVSIMRANAEQLSRLAKARAERSGHVTAVDDLKSYAEISAAHAEGTRKLIPAFQALYDSMTPEQQKATDAEFRGHYSEARRASR